MSAQSILRDKRGEPITKDEFLTLAEIKELLEKERELRELTTEQNYALTHAQRFAKLDAKESRKLVNDLLKIKELGEYHGCKLADIMPRYPDEVRAIFAKERFILEEDTIDQIIDTIDKYR